MLACRSITSGTLSPLRLNTHVITRLSGTQAATKTTGSLQEGPGSSTPGWRRPPAPWGCHRATAVTIRVTRPAKKPGEAKQPAPDHQHQHQHQH